MAFGALTVAIALVAALSSGTSGTRPAGLPLFGDVPVAVGAVVVLAFLAGVAYSSTAVSAQTALFEHMPLAVRGRVFGVLASIVSAASLVPTVLAGPLADALSPPVVIGAVGLGVVSIGLLSARLLDAKARS